MASQRTRRDEEGGDERPRRGAQKSSPGLFGMAIVLFVLAGVMVLYVLTRNKVAPPPPKTEQVNPFADLPPEAPPEKQAKTKGQK